MISLYTPPPGYYDLPFTWIYDAAALTNGNNYPNQFVYILGGYGRFIMRRVVGLDRVLANGAAPGSYQIKDASGNYIEASPILTNAGVNPGVVGVDIPISPEIEYPETGKVNFDLFKILRRTEQTQGGTPIYSSQIGFQGVRRLAGVSPLVTPGTFKPKTFTYVQTVTITNVAFGAGGGATPPLRVYQKVNDYDFELHQVKLVYSNPALSGCGAKLWIYDSNKNTISSQPGLDVFFNDNSYYKNGALVPPLFYPVNSQIQVDITSLLPAGLVPMTAVLHLIGRQRYPC